jgi:hypothetical protein
MLLWFMMSVQFLGWAWFSVKGGHLNNQEFLIFSGTMMFGQVAAGVDSYCSKAWKAFAAQAYFGVFTVVGAVARFLQM